MAMQHMDLPGISRVLLIPESFPQQETAPGSTIEENDRNFVKDLGHKSKLYRK